MSYYFAAGTKMFVLHWRTAMDEYRI